MATIMIGTIAVPIQPICMAEPKNLVRENSLKQKSVVLQHQMATHQPSIKGIAHALRQTGAKLISEYDMSIQRMDMALSQNPMVQRQLLIKEHSPITKYKKGTFRIRHITQQQAEEKKLAMEKAQQETQDFLDGKYENCAYIGHVKGPIVNGKGEQVSFKTTYYRRTPKSPMIHKKHKKHITVQQVIEELLPLARIRAKPMQFIGKRKDKVDIKYVYKRDSIIPKIRLPHEDGKYMRQEVRSPFVGEMLTNLCKFARYGVLFDNDITDGDSGLLFDRRSHITRCNTKLSHFIVRGRRFGKLVNALETIEDIFEIQHY
nr:P1 [Paris mosaic necrosis virus]